MYTARDYHSLCLLKAEPLGVAMLGVGGLALGGIHIEGSIEINIITERWLAELQIQHLHRSWAESKDNLVTWDHSGIPEDHSPLNIRQFKSKGLERTPDSGSPPRKPKLYRTNNWLSPSHSHETSESLEDRSRQNPNE